MGQQLDQGLIGNIRDSLTRYMASRNEDIGGNYANDTGGEISHYLSRENRDVYGIDMRDKLIDTPFFAHPMVIQDKTPMKENSVGGYDNFKIVADMRAVIDKDRTGKLKIINNAAYITLAARAVITQWWLAHGTIGPLRSMPVALPIFTDVIGDMLGSIKMELDDAQRLRVWAGIWYYMAHLEKSLTDLKPDEKFNIIKTLEELMAEELVPFQSAIDGGVNFVMVGHISAPNVTGDNAPATLSKVMITDVLRGQMGYNGIVITDAMNMEAITGFYNSDKAAVLAVTAGADMILMPADYNTAYTGILNAVNDGTITEERINESVTRIVKAKLAMGQP
jgi:hypothetical protein